MSSRASAQSYAVDRPTLRKLLRAVLLTDTDLDAFCLDYFGEVQRRFSNGMDREAKVNLLLERQDTEAILKALTLAHPQAVERHLPLSPNPAAQSGPPAQEVLKTTNRPLPATTLRSTPTPTGAKDWRWDFFIAHAGADTEPAVQLYQGLTQQGHRAYLAKKCLLPGDDWNLELPKAQRQAQMTVVLVSAQCERAYYQREEIAAAIALARDEKYSHRVVPVYLDGWPADTADIPYGLRSKQGLNAGELGGMAGIAQALDDLVNALRKREAGDALE